MKTNRYIFSLLLLVVSAFNLLPANAQQNQYAIYNYRNDGDFNAWLNIDVEKITYSCIDTLGVEHDEVVVQEVWTPDSVYRIPINAIDSIGFHAPKPVMREGLFYLREYHASHTVQIDSLTLYFDTSIRNDSLPAIGQVVLNGTNISPYEEGFAGRVIKIERLSHSIKMECEMIAVGDVYKRLVLVGKGITESANNTPAKIMRANGDPWIDFQETDVKTFKNLGDLKVECLNGILSITSKDPTLVVGYYVYVDELFYSMSVDCSLIHHDIESKVTLSIEKIKELAEVSGDVAETIKRLKDFKDIDKWLEKILKEQIEEGNKEKEDKDEIDLIEHLWKKANFSKSIPIAGPLLLDLEVGPLLKLKGDVEYAMTLKNKAKQTFHLSAKGNTMMTLSNPTIAVLTGAASIKGSSTFDSEPFHSMSINATAKGSLSVGFTGKIGLSLIHKNVVHANLSAQAGLKASAALDVKYMDTAVDENDWTPYEAIKETKIKLEKFAKAGVEFGITKSKFFTWGAEWEFWSKDVGVMYLVPHFSQPALPTFKDGQWSNGNWNNHLVLQSLPTKNIPDLFLGSCKVALRIVDEQGKVVKETKEREYRDDGMITWQINPLEVDLSDLTPGKTYRCYPTLHYWNMKPAKATPSYEFTVPHPVSTQTSSVTVRPDEVLQITFTGGWGDYQVMVGDADIATASFGKSDNSTGAGGGGSTTWTSNFSAGGGGGSSTWGDEELPTINVVGKKVGETTITLKDLRSNETATLNVTVSDEVIPNLALSETTVSMKPNETAEVAITSGSGSYTVANSNEEVAVAAISNGDKIAIAALKAGTTTITVTDTKTKQTATIAVTVTDNTHPNKDGQIVMERKYKVHHGGNYHEPRIILDFGNKQVLHVGYLKMNWWGDYSHTKHGIHIIAGDDWLKANEENVWYIAPTIADEWVTEKLIVDLDGKVQYYMNGQYMGEKTFTGIDLSNAKMVSIQARPYGWWTGHSHYMDDFSLTTPFTSISDDFNDGVLDTNIWLTPVNPDGVREEDGILKMEMLRTDQDFDLRSKPIPLFKEDFLELCPDNNHPHTIDLGLPYGALWACCNVGATKPVEYGDYFAWGETKPKENYNWGTYKWCNGSSNSLTKYTGSDAKTELDLEDDAAYVNWGSNWRMPSLDQIKELIDNCNWEWATINGILGTRITGENGNSIFLPASSFKDYNSSPSAGQYGSYYGRTYNSTTLNSAEFIFGTADWRNNWNNGDFYYEMGIYGGRHCGRSIRPVRMSNQNSGTGSGTGSGGDSDGSGTGGGRNRN